MAGRRGKSQFQLANKFVSQARILLTLRSSHQYAQFRHSVFLPVGRVSRSYTAILGGVGFVAVWCSSVLRETLKGELQESTMVIDPENCGENIRKRFLEFYQAQGHKIFPSSSLVPEDPTVLLTFAGMLQFKPIFLGQVCRHLDRQFFSARFRGRFKLPAERVFVSAFKNNNEAFAIWRDQVGVSIERIKRMGTEDNFWESGPTGPCGPCSDMYYDFHPQRGLADAISLERSTRPWRSWTRTCWRNLTRVSSSKLHGWKTKSASSPKSGSLRTDFIALENRPSTRNLHGCTCRVASTQSQSFLLLHCFVPF